MAGVSPPKKNSKKAPPAKPKGQKREAVLNHRQRLLLLYLAEGMNQREAALKAGYSAKTVDSIASTTLKRPVVQQCFKSILDAAGVSDERLAQKISDLLDAQKCISAIVIGGGKKGKDQPEADSRTTDFIEVPDNQAQISVTKLALQAKGHLVEKREEKLSGEVIVNIREYGTGNKRELARYKA